MPEVKDALPRLKDYHARRAEAHAAGYDALAEAVTRDLGERLAAACDWNGVTRQLFRLDDPAADPLSLPDSVCVAVQPDGHHPFACRYRRQPDGSWKLAPWGGPEFRVKSQDVPYLDAYWLVVVRPQRRSERHVVGCHDLASAMVYARKGEG